MVDQSKIADVRKRFEKYSGPVVNAGGVLRSLARNTHSAAMARDMGAEIAPVIPGSVATSDRIPTLGRSGSLMPRVAGGIC
jgi:hypothetical protein